MLPRGAVHPICQEASCKPDSPWHSPLSYCSLTWRAGFADSIRAQYGQVALVDDGGFFPEGDGQQDLAWFIMDVMHRLNTDAVGVGERDLRYGASFLRAQVKLN